MSYGWKERAYGVSGLDAEKCGTELDRLSKIKPLTPESVLHAARLKSSPLHDGFTWDDTEAAKQHRMSEARYMIAAVVIVIDDEHPPIRAFCNIKTPDNPSDIIDFTKKASLLSRQQKKE